MLTVVKVGGAILENAEKCSVFLDAFCAVNGPKLLVHGGGRTSSHLMKQLGMEPKLIDGRRVTDSATLEIVTMAYAGLNKQLVARLHARSLKAVGLCGADENVLIAQKRPPVPVDFGWVGDVTKEGVRARVLLGYLKHNIVPVIAPLSHDGKGNLLNTNADTIASVVAQALAEHEEVRLIYGFEKPGLLWDAADESTLIETFSRGMLGRAIYDGHIHTGMIPKLNNAFAALEDGVQEVIICHAEQVALLDTKTQLTL